MWLSAIRSPGLEHILGGPTRQRVTYDNLSLTQFIQGFVKNVLDEPCQKSKEKMLHYLGDLMEDATDFSWANAKAAHAVLLCKMERGALTWVDTSRIERIRRAMPKSITHPSQIGPKIKIIRDLGFASSTRVVLVVFSRTMKCQAGYIGTYVSSAYLRGFN